MQLHEIKPIHQLKDKKRIGRGGKRGTYSGKGMKGQKARAGAKIRPAWRDLLKQIPKKRGFKFKSIKTKPTIVSFAALEKQFKEGEKINPQKLLDKGLIQKIKGRIPTVKILGGGKAIKKFVIENCLFSQSVAKQLKDK